MNCFQALRSPLELAEGLLPLSEGDIIIQVDNSDANGWNMGICNGNIGFYWADDVVATELQASADDAALFLALQRSQADAGRRDSAASALSASSSSATTATVKSSREPRPSVGEGNGELATYLHSARPFDDDSDRDVNSADLASPPPVVELSWGSDSDDGAAHAPPDVSALLDPELFDNDQNGSANMSIATSPAFQAAGSQPSHLSDKTAASASSLKTAETHRTPGAFIVHSKKHSIIPLPSAAEPREAVQTQVQASPPAISDSPNQPAASAPKQQKNKRGSVFTVAATQIMQQNPDKFKSLEAVGAERDQARNSVDVGGHDRREQRKSAAQMEMETGQELAEEEAETEEIDWSPGSEFVKFASITTLPSLQIIYAPAITDEYMATLAQYKSEFITCIFNASSNRNRSSRMKIFTGRQFVEFCLSDVCSAELRLTERGSAIGIGKLMCLYDFIHEVEDEHDFADSEDLKFRFVSDEAEAYIETRSTLSSVVAYAKKSPSGGISDQKLFCLRYIFSASICKANSVKWEDASIVLIQKLGSYYLHTYANTWDSQPDIQLPITSKTVVTEHFTNSDKRKKVPILVIKSSAALQQDSELSINLGDSIIHLTWIQAFLQTPAAVAAASITKVLQKSFPVSIKATSADFIAHGGEDSGFMYSLHVEMSDGYAGSITRLERDIFELHASVTKKHMVYELSSFLPAKGTIEDNPNLRPQAIDIYFAKLLAFKRLARSTELIKWVTFDDQLYTSGGRKASVGDLRKGSVGDASALKNELNTCVVKFSLHSPAESNITHILSRYSNSVDTAHFCYAICVVVDGKTVAQSDLFYEINSPDIKPLFIPLHQLPEHDSVCLKLMLLSDKARIEVSSVQDWKLVDGAGAQHSGVFESDGTALVEIRSKSRLTFIKAEIQDTIDHAFTFHLQANEAVADNQSDRALALNLVALSWWQRQKMIHPIFCKVLLETGSLYFVHQDADMAIAFLEAGLAFSHRLKLQDKQDDWFFQNDSIADGLQELAMARFFKGHYVRSLSCLLEALYLKQQFYLEEELDDSLLEVAANKISLIYTQLMFVINDALSPDSIDILSLSIAILGFHVCLGALQHSFVFHVEDSRFVVVFKYASMFIQTKVVQFLLTAFSATSKDGFTCYKKVPTVQSGVAPALFSQLARAHLRCKRIRESGTGKHLGSRSSAVALAIQSLVFSRVLTPSMQICPPYVESDTSTIISPTHFPALIQDSASCVLVRVSIIKTKSADLASAPPQRQGLMEAFKSSVQPRPHRRSTLTAVEDADEGEDELESGAIHAALAVMGKPPIRMVVNELLVYWGSTVAKLDGSNKKFIGFIIMVGSSDDGPVPPIRIMYESSSLLREHELRISSCFPIEKETKNYYISDLTRAHTLEYQSHSAFIVALEFARNEDLAHQIKAGLLMTLSIDKLNEALELLEEARGGAQQSDAEADAQRTMMEDLAFRLYYTAVCFPQLFQFSSMREAMVERAIAIRISMGHHVSTSNPAVLLKNMLAQHESRLLYTKQQNAGQFLHRINVSMVSQRKRTSAGGGGNQIMVENDDSGRQLEDEYMLITMSDIISAGG